MTARVGAKALIPNPALKTLEFLVGEWDLTGSHPYLPDTILHGRTSFTWHEGGAFLVSHSEIDHPKFPDGVEIFGSDDESKEYFVLHFDARGVSRKYNLAVVENGLKWWRDNSSFSQRFILTTEANGRMLSRGEMSRDNGAWEKDLELTYERIAKKS